MGKQKLCFARPVWGRVLLLPLKSEGSLCLGTSLVAGDLLLCQQMGQISKKGQSSHRDRASQNSLERPSKAVPSTRGALAPLQTQTLPEKAFEIKWRGCAGIPPASQAQQLRLA